MRDPLATLLRLRQTGLDDAQRSLADAITAEHQAETRRRAAAQAILDETQCALNAAEDHDVERFALWLKRGRATLRHAEHALADAAAHTASRRAELTLARAATEATEKAIATRAATNRLAQDRTAQQAQDEIGHRR